MYNSTCRLHLRYRRVPGEEEDQVDNKKRIRSQAFKADKLIQILLEYEAIEDVSDVDGLREYIAECDHVSRSPHHVVLFSYFLSSPPY